MKGAQVGERVCSQDGGSHGTVLRRDPWMYLLTIAWDDGRFGVVHEMYVEPSRVPASAPVQADADSATANTRPKAPSPESSYRPAGGTL